MDHQLRRTALTARLGDLEVDALLVSRLPNVRYLTGFTGSNGQLIAGTNQALFLTDGRYTEQATHVVPDLERVTYLKGLEAPLRELCARLGVRRLGFESHDVSVHQNGRFADALPDVELVAAGEEVEHLRWVKDDDELDMLRRAQAATDEAFDDILEFLAVGESERQVALELERLLRRDGADVELTARDWRLLEYLALRRGQVVARSEIEAHIYDELVAPMSNVVDTAVYNLRRKIGHNFIRTRRGLGYVLDAE